MNIVEQIIIVAANELVEDYCAFVNADMEFDGGEYSGRSEPEIPVGVAAAHNLIQELDFYLPNEDFFGSDEAKYPDGY